MHSYVDLSLHIGLAIAVKVQDTVSLLMAVYYLGTTSSVVTWRKLKEEEE